MEEGLWEHFDTVLTRIQKLFISILWIALIGGTVIEVNSFLEQVKLYVNEKP